MTALAEQVQEATEQNVEMAYVDQGYTGKKAAEAAAAPMASLWRGSNSPKPSAASCSCPAAG